MTAESLTAEYQRYLERFDRLVGPCEVDRYAKHAGRLIKKMQQAEFEEKWRELQDVSRAYDDIMARGDTINDIVVKVLRERSDDLLLDRKL